MDLKELLGEELYKQVTEKLGDKKIMIDDGNFIPKARFNEVNEAKKELEKELSNKVKEIENLSAKAQGNEELIKQELEAKHLEEKNELKKNYAVDNILSKTECHDIEDVKKFIDMSKITYQDDTLNGLEEQLSSLKESKSYLFKTEEKAPGGSGFNPTGGNEETGITKEKFKTMNMTQRIKLRSENPSLYEELTK